MSSEVAIFSRVSRENQHFFLNSAEIPGVQTFTADYQQNVATFKALGMNNSKLFPRGIQAGNIGISSLLISDDNFLPLTGVASFEGFVTQRTNDLGANFGFTSAYLTSYSSRYSFGSLPTIDINATVFGDMGKLILFTQDIVNTPFILKVPGPGCVTINLDDYTTNRLTAYTVDLTVNRNPIFGIGDRYPKEVKINYPIEVACSFQLEVNDYNFKKLRDYPYNKTVENLSLTVKSYDTEETVTSYSFNDLECVGQSYNSTVDDNLLLNLSYKGLING